MYLNNSSNASYLDSFVLEVLVIIDAKPKDLGLPTEAYVAVEEVHDVSIAYFNPDFSSG